MLAALVALFGCRTELKLEHGRRYLCSRDAGESPAQCTPGFRCGLDGYCFDTDAGEARACESSLDCAPAWRCGLTTNGVGACQQLGVPLPLPCSDDSWCEGDWRCGPAGVCVDATADALEPSTARALPVTRLSPRFPAPLVALGVAAIDTGGWQSAMLSGSGLTVVSALPRELRVQRLAIDGGIAIAASPQTMAIVEAAGRTRVVSQSVDGAFGQERVIPFPAFRPVGALLAPPADVRNLTLPPLLLTWNDTAFAAWNLGLDGLEALPAPPGTISAMHVSSDDPSFLLAATSLGAFEFERQKSVSWRLLKTQAAKACTGEAIDVRAIAPRTVDNSVAALYSDADGGRGCISLFTFSRDGGLSGPSDTACEDRDQPRGVRPIDDGGTGIWIRCEGPGPGEFVERGFCTGSPCVGPRTFFPRPRDRARARSETLDLVVDELGFQVMINGEDVQRPQFGSAVVPGVAEFESLVALTGEGSAPTLVGRPREGDGGLSKFELVPDFGFAKAVNALDPADELPLAPVAQTADWRVLANGEIRSGAQAKPLARFTPVRPLEGDVVATARPGLDGGGFIYVSSFDSLFAGPTGATGPTLPLRLVPASRSQITSLAAAPEPLSQPDGGVVQHVGYLVNQGRLFRFEARNQVWRSEEIELPEPAVSVWYDGARARVGTESGQIFGLPTRVRLTGALPGGATASTFVSLCRRSFAVAQPGVFALGGPDGGLATWQLDTELTSALPLRRPDVTATRPPGVGLSLVALDAVLVAVNADGVVVSRRFECDAGNP